MKTTELKNRINELTEEVYNKIREFEANIELAKYYQLNLVKKAF
jgi:hypothetical protein